MLEEACAAVVPGWAEVRAAQAVVRVRLASLDPPAVVDVYDVEHGALQRIVAGVRAGRPLPGSVAGVLDEATGRGGQAERVALGRLANVLQAELDRARREAVDDLVVWLRARLEDRPAEVRAAQAELVRVALGDRARAARLVSECGIFERSERLPLWRARLEPGWDGQDVQDPGPEWLPTVGELVAKAQELAAAAAEAGLRAAFDERGADVEKYWPEGNERADMVAAVRRAAAEAVLG